MIDGSIPKALDWLRDSEVADMEYHEQEWREAMEKAHDEYAWLLWRMKEYEAQVSELKAQLKAANEPRPYWGGFGPG